MTPTPTRVESFSIKLPSRSIYIGFVQTIEMSLDSSRLSRRPCGGGFVWSLQREEISLIKSACPFLKTIAHQSDPDVGVDPDIAQFYFMQLISAMVVTIRDEADLRRCSATAKALLTEVRPIEYLMSDDRYQT
jgi:hypothetical protein